MNILLALFFCGCAVAALGVSRWRTGDFGSPAAVVAATWSFSAGLFLLRMLPYPAIPPRAAAVLVLGVASLLAGMWLAVPLARRAAPRVWPIQHPAAWVVAFSLLGIAGTVWYAWEVHRLLGLGALIHEAGRIRVALARYVIPSRFLFLQFFCMIAPTMAVGIALGGARLRAWHWALAAVCAASTWITTDRTQFFMIVLAVLFMYLLRHGRQLSAMRSLVALVAAGIALAANFLAVGYWTGRSPENLGFALSAPRTTVAATALVPAAAPVSARPAPPSAAPPVARPPAPPTARPAAPSAAPPVARLPVPPAGRPAAAVAPPPPRLAAPAAPVPAVTSPPPGSVPVRAPNIRNQLVVRMEDGTLDAPDSAQMEPIAPGVKNPFLATALKKTSTLYLYTTGSYAGFGLWYPPPGPLTWGLNCAYPAVRLLNRAGLLSRQPPLQVPGFTKVVRRGNAAIFFNGYTFLYYPIRDFGLVGMVAYCLLIGFLVGTVYERLRRVRSSSIHLLLMAQISIGLVLSIFVNKFNNTTSWYLAVVTTAPFWLTAVAHRVAGRREPLVREAALDGK